MLNVFSARLLWNSVQYSPLENDIRVVAIILMGVLAEKKCLN